MEKMHFVLGRVDVDVHIFGGNLQAEVGKAVCATWQVGAVHWQEQQQGQVAQAKLAAPQRFSYPEPVPEPARGWAAGACYYLPSSTAFLMVAEWTDRLLIKRTKVCFLTL